MPGLPVPLIVESAHSKPTSVMVSVICRIGRLSVSTTGRCESFSVFAKVLPSVLDEMSPDLPSVQEEPYRNLPNVLSRNLPTVQEPYRNLNLPNVLCPSRNLPNVQDDLYHDLPSVQDEPYPPECRPQFGAHSQSGKVLLTDLQVVHFCQHSLIQFLHTLSESQLTLEEVGSIHCQPDLQSCKGGQATAAIYAKL
jgi:hypothetical protein